MMRLNHFPIAVWVAAGSLLMAAPAFASANYGNLEGQGQAVVTVLPQHEGKAVPSVSPSDLTLKVDGKLSNVTHWTPLRGPAHQIELVLLIDDSARTSLGTQMGDLQNFIREMPANAKMAIAYMENGQAVFAGPLTTDHQALLRELHLPLPGTPGVTASPYFCLSDLAKHWPSHNPGARREVVMITDGVDNYYLRYDPEDPYVLASIEDSLRAHLVVYSIYWHSQGWVSSTGYETNAGQNLLEELTQATGGYSYWIGYGNPVSFEPYFTNIMERVHHQYGLSFLAPLQGKSEVESLKLQVRHPHAKFQAPGQTYVIPAGPAGTDGE